MIEVVGVLTAMRKYNFLTKKLSLTTGNYIGFTCCCEKFHLSN